MTKPEARTPHPKPTLRKSLLSTAGESRLDIGFSRLILAGVLTDGKADSTNTGSTDYDSRRKCSPFKEPM